MNAIIQKFKEASFSVLPIVGIVLVLNFTVSPLAVPSLLRFLLGALCIVLGLCLFLFGVEVSIDPIGELLGSAIVKTNKIWVVAAAGMLLGFIISIAEPDLHILAAQVDLVTLGHISKPSIVMLVSVGIAAMLSFGLVRIIYNIPLKLCLSVLYGVVLVLSFFASPEFLAISFDASGATTGALTVPFILALALGVAAMKKDSLASEKDSFGLVAITSTGAIISVMVMSIVSPKEGLSGGIETGFSAPSGIIIPFVKALPTVALEIALALSPIIIVYLLFQKLYGKSAGKNTRILIGLLYAFVGLVLLITGVNAGFMDVGRTLGYTVASMNNEAVLISTGFALGFVTVLAEPAVHALTNQIETVTSGYVRKRTVLAALSVGIGIAIALSMLRILIPGLKLWHFLLPGYAIAIGMSYYIPNLFVGIAFDSGGVASGPMTATFILSFAQGAAGAIKGADVLTDGFGIISMVALTPLITLQALGLIFHIKSKKGGLEANGTDS